MKRRRIAAIGLGALLALGLAAVRSGELSAQAGTLCVVVKLAIVQEATLERKEGAEAPATGKTMKGGSFRIKLSRKQAEFIVRSERFPAVVRDQLRDQVMSDPAKPYAHVLVDADLADNVRDTAGDILQENGFDKRYEVTEDGRILEDLIDLFLIANE